MKVVVLGAGAIGCLYGGLLARSGVDVTFIARGETLSYLQNHNLEVQSIKGDFSLPVHVIDGTQLQIVKGCDLIILAVKSTALAEVLPQLEQLVTDQTKILCLLNGIGNEEVLAERFGEDKIIGGAAYVSVILERPGLIRHVAKGDMELVIGPWNNGISDFDQSLTDAFQRANVEVLLSENIKQVKWEKLVWNMIYNPITALTRTTVGEAAKNHDLFFIMKQMVQEYFSVAESEGIDLDPHMAEIYMVPTENQKKHKTSMLQDLEKGRKMELEPILGHVIKIANQNKICVPTMETIYHLLQFEECKIRESAN